MARAQRAVVVGTGMIGAVHARAVRAAGATLQGVLASSPARGARVAADWGASVGYPDFEAVLADDAVEVVHLCTPNTLHADQTMAALGAGKHVICEKPLATSVADAQRVTDAALAAGLVLAVPFVYRYHPLVREIRQRRRRGEFGAWQLLHGSYLQDWMLPADAASWRVDPAIGGPSRAFADIGSHWCDLVEWVAGVRFAEVAARLGTTTGTRPSATTATFGAAGRDTGSEQPAARAPRLPVHTEDVAAVLLRTAEGVLGTLTVSQVSAGRKNRLWFELDGALGSAVFDQENPETVWLGSRAGAQILFRDSEHGSAEQRRLSILPAGHAQGYADCFNAFVADTYAAMDGDKPDGLPTGVDGVRSARLVESVLRSDATLAWTPVEPEATA